MSEEQRLVVAEGIGRILGQILTYKVLRKTGAPTYVAYLGCVIIAQLRDISDPYEPKLKKVFRR